MTCSPSARANGAWSCTTLCWGTHPTRPSRLQISCVRTPAAGWTLTWSSEAWRSWPSSFAGHRGPVLLASDDRSARRGAWERADKHLRERFRARADRQAARAGRTRAVVDGSVRTLSTLAAYDGTLVLVSHDERFLERVGVTRRLVVQDGSVAEVQAGQT